MRGGEQRAAVELENSLPLGDIAAGAVMELSGAHRSLELGFACDFTEKRVSRKQHVVIEENIVDADDPGFAKRDIVGLGRALKHFEAEAEMGVVVEIGAGGDHPIDETVLDQWNDARHAETGRRQRAGQTNTYDGVV